MSRTSTEGRPSQCLTRLCADAGLTRRELAQRTGYSHSQICRVVGGRSRPGEKLVWALADVLGQRRSDLADSLAREARASQTVNQLVAAGWDPMDVSW